MSVFPNTSNYCVKLAEGLIHQSFSSTFIWFFCNSDFSSPHILTRECITESHYCNSLGSATLKTLLSYKKKVLVKNKRKKANKQPKSKQIKSKSCKTIKPSEEDRAPLSFLQRTMQRGRVGFSVWPVMCACVAAYTSRPQAMPLSEDHRKL